MRRTRLTLVLTVLGVAALIGGVAISQAAGNRANHAHKTTKHSTSVSRIATRHRPMIAAVPARLIKAFPVFSRQDRRTERRAKSAAAQTLPSDLLVPAEQQFGLNLSLEQQVFASDAMTISLLPGAGETCAVVSQAGGGGSISCTTNAVAESQGLVTSDNNGSTTHWYGVLPAGTHNMTFSGVAMPASDMASTGGFSYTAASSALLSYVGPEGNTMTRAAAQPVPAPGG